MTRVPLCFIVALPVVWLGKTGAIIRIAIVHRVGAVRSSGPARRHGTITSSTDRASDRKVEGILKSDILGYEMIVDCLFFSGIIHVRPLCVMLLFDRFFL